MSAMVMHRLRQLPDVASTCFSRFCAARRREWLTSTSSSSSSSSRACKLNSSFTVSAMCCRRPAQTASTGYFRERIGRFFRSHLDHNTITGINLALDAGLLRTNCTPPQK